MPIQNSAWNRPGAQACEPQVPGSEIMATAARSSTRPAPRHRPAGRTRASAAWVGIGSGVVVLVLLIVFMLQNTEPVRVSFFGLHGSAPLALTLLIAGVGVGLVALISGSLRIAQLRHRIGVDRKAEDRKADDRKAVAPSRRPTAGAHSRPRPATAPDRR